MEATAVSVGKAVLDGALSYAKSSISEEVALQLGIKRDHAFIRDELEMMQSFLMAAQEGQDEHKVLKSWVKQVRQLSYDVEDCLQDFAIHLDNPSWWRPRTLLDQRRIAKKMKDLRARVEDVSQRNLRYHLIIRGSSFTKAAVATEKPSITFATMFDTDKARERHAKKNKAKVDLVHLISKKDADLRVIAVWGTNCDVSQTSIIRRAYDDLKIQETFKCQAWIRMMHPFNQTEFLHSIMMQFYSREMGAQALRKMGKMKQDDLVEEFNNHVTKERYLVVFNEVRTIEDWDWIKTYFPNNKNGSRIIVSTEEVGVARLCIGRKYLVSELEELSADQTHFACYDFDEVSQADNVHENESVYLIETKVGRKYLNRINTYVGGSEIFQPFGRWKEKRYIMELILNQNDQAIAVISVWGIGDLGKTTLVKEVYQNVDVRKVFHKLAWVKVMHPFDLEELFKSLIMQLGATTIGVEGVEGLRQKLVKLLQGNKCLIVLDNLASIAQWDLIALPLRSASRIIVITREENIAKHCSYKQEHIYKLQNLDNKDALDLFTIKVLKNEHIDLFEYPDMVEQAKLILRKCAGLPLAIVTIGSFLANQPKTAMEWTKVNEHISAELEMHPELDPPRAVIAKSYDGLPYHLKSCLLYLSIFRNEQDVRWGRLVRRWISEGYLKDTSKKSAEEIAYNYLMELRDKSMVLLSERSFHRRQQACQVQKTIYEISVSKSMEANLVFTLEEDCRLQAQITTHHLAVSTSWVGDEAEFESMVDISQIRSLTIFGKYRPFFISGKMRLLQVLDLENTSGLVGEHLEPVCKLLRLTYISLRGCVDICHLPDSLGNLRRLLTLDIRGTSITMMPKTFVKLLMLQYLYAGQKTIDECSNEESSVPKMKVSCAPLLFLDAAQRLDQHGVVVPRGIGKLKALQTLWAVNITRGKNDAHLEEIKRLTWLRKLGVVGINKKNCREFCSILADLNRLESVSVRATEELGLYGCLDFVPWPPTNLQSLNLYGNLVRLPEWIWGLRNLVKLKLEKTKLLEVDAIIQLLGALPNLAILRLLHDTFQGVEEFHVTFYEYVFPSLIALQLSCIHGLRFVKFEEGAMGKLEQLSFIGNPSRSHAGVFSGLACLPRLEEFVLDNNDKYMADFLGDVEEQLAMNPNCPVLRRRNFQEMV